MKQSEFLIGVVGFVPTFVVVLNAILSINTSDVVNYGVMVNAGAVWFGLLMASLAGIFVALLLIQLLNAIESDLTASKS